MNVFNIQDELKKLPEKPGVYIMKDEFGEIIYVGKAVVLKNRVRQYFQSFSGLAPKVQAMVSRIKEFEYIVTDSELEALILECNLIKKHKPKFNILLKDDKSYPYIKVTMHEEFPRVLMTRKIEKDGAKYFGPYSNVYAVKETIEIIKKIFPIKTCSKVLPRDMGKDRPCLNYHIYQCMGPCQGDINREAYRSIMKDICSFLNGRQEEIVQRLEKEMKAAAETMEFEKAARIRDKINSLKHIAEKQKVLSTTMEDQDVIAFAKGQTDSCVQVFFIRSGKLIGREHFIFEGAGELEDGELMASSVKQFYSTVSFIPNEIILQQDIDEINIIESWLSDRKEAKVHIKVPRKGDKLHLIEMVSKNALLTLNQFKEKIKTEEALAREGVELITSLLELKKKPERIEAYDISNTGALEMVASMIVYESGKPANREYRRFKIKTLNVQNDYGSMQEVIFRRFRHARKEQEELEQNHAGDMKEGKFSKLPDLILVDGGLGHVNVAKGVLSDLGLEIPVYGMVKDGNHRTRALIGENREMDIAGNLPLLRFVTAIQDEAHRFALEYNKKLRAKRTSGSILDEIEGVGPKRKKKLLKHFGSVGKIRAAALDELLQVEGVSRSAAENIYDFFRQ